MRLTKKRLIRYLLPLLSLLIIAGGTFLAIKFAKGYRPTRTGIQGTGLLAANSFPPGAEVYLNSKLTTATDDTLNLPPGDYTITIKKEGYSAWEKQLQIEAELVTQTNATLFKAVPSLTPLTLSGAVNISPSPDGQKIAYAVASASASAKNGLYVLTLNSTPLSLQNSPKQIARDRGAKTFAQADLIWSPNSSQLLVSFHTDQPDSAAYLISADSLNELEDLPDVSARLPIILSEWEEDIVLRETKQFSLLPQELQRLATQSATTLYFSPNEERLLYTTKGYDELPPNLIPPLPASSTQPEVRQLEPNQVYVYDLIEDKNFLIGSIPTDQQIPEKLPLLLESYQQLDVTDANITPSGNIESITRFSHLQNPDSLIQTFQNFRLHYSSLYSLPYQWYPDSHHLIITTDRLDIIEYDGTNHVTIYNGPFSFDFSYPWPDGSKIILPISFNLSTDAMINLYALDIK